MVKHIHQLQTSVRFVPDHKGAPYTVDGRHFFNAGNFAECAVNEYEGFGFGYDTHAVPFDKGSDIEPLRMSVKSSKFSLACLYGTDRDSIIAEYFRRCHSKVWRYVVQVDSEFWFYDMNQAEFAEFLDVWSIASRADSKTDLLKVKGKATSGKMLQWLEERVER